MVHCRRCIVPVRVCVWGGGGIQGKKMREVVRERVGEMK